MTPTKKQSFVRDDIFSDTQGGVGVAGLTFIQTDVVGVVEREESRYFGVLLMTHLDDVRKHCVQENVHIFQHLSEPETLHIINKTRIRIVDIIDTSKRDRGGQELVEARDGTDSAIEELCVSCHAPRVEVGFEDFGSENILGGAREEEEAILVVKGNVRGRRVGPSEVTIRREETKGFGAYASTVSGIDER